MNYVGGLRLRLIRDSLYSMIDDALHAMGWFDEGRNHLPVHFRSEPYPADVEIPLNTLVLADDSMTPYDAEMGSSLGEFIYRVYADFYAENDTIGRHLIQDLTALLEGRVASAGRTRPNFVVWDYTQATPTELFYCQIEDVIWDKALDFPKPWQRHWYSCRFDIIDVYADESY